MKRRQTKRDIDYKALNDRGVYIYKEHFSVRQSETSRHTSSSSDELEVEPAEIEDSFQVDQPSCVNPPVLTLPSTERNPFVTQIANKLEDFAIEESVSIMSESGKDVLSKTISKLSCLCEEIRDYIEENLPDMLVVVDDIDSCCSRVEKYRSELRSIHGEFDASSLDVEQSEEWSSAYSTIRDEIKTYIHAAKDKRRSIREREFEVHNQSMSLEEEKYIEEVNQKCQAAEFVISEVRRLINEGLKVFSNANTDEVTDDEITVRNDELRSNLSKLDYLSTKFQNMLQLIPGQYVNRRAIVAEITERYNDLIGKKGKYETELKLQVQKRELTKEKLFQVSALNIKLEVFKGYNSELDIYTFQSEFEKLKSKSTPKNKLPDLLKNNYLEDPALALVKSVEDIEEIWRRLKKAYGDPKTMLDKKLADVKSIGPLWKIKDSGRLIEGFANITNSMVDLMRLSKRHKIEGRLYNGEALDVIYGMLGERRVTRWLEEVYDKELVIDEEGDTASLEGENLWKALIKFLEKEMKLEQEKFSIKRRLEGLKYSTDGSKSMSHWSRSEDPEFRSEEHCSCCSIANTRKHLDPREEESKDGKRCSFCNELGHVETNGPRASTLIQYFACHHFVEMTPAQRYQELRSKELCFQCLYPGANQNYGTHIDGSCQKDYVCKHPSHDRYPLKKHVLVCHEHRNTQENKNLLAEYKQKFILHQTRLPKFSKDIKLSFVTYASYSENFQSIDERDIKDDEIVTDNGIFMLQRIKIGDEHFTIFFDSGCSDMVCQFNAIKRMGERATQEIAGPISLGGVGNLNVVSSHGVYQVRLPLHNGKNAVLSGICLDQITSTFPTYPLHGKIKSDIHKAYIQAGGDVSELPSFPESIGGEVDIMIGTKYFRYHPVPIFSLPSGLTVYRSPFVNATGGCGVIGGPHEVITQINKMKSTSCQYSSSYLSDQFKLYKMGYCINPDNNLLSVKLEKDFHLNILTESLEDFKYCSHEPENKCFVTKKQKYFETVENAASEISYRCVDCRECKKCRNGEQIEMLSIKEEIEQDLINSTVKVDINRGITIARLPLLENPALRLAPNKDKALAVYKSQLKRLAKSDKDKQDVIEAEGKLQSMGHVEFVSNLSEEQQLKLKEDPIQYYIPWAAVWNLNSVSSPCRLVFNGSLPTKSSLGLNDILAKGRNNLNKLVEIVIRWMTHQYAYHTDVQKMYNAIKLVEEHWCLQRYIWQRNLDILRIPEEKVIKTLIYGIKSSGNQAERGLRMTAEICKDEFPEVNRIVQGDVYVDDCISGENTRELMYQRADELSLVLRRGGFNLKGFTFSGDKPLKSLSEDSESVKVAGIKWFPESDQIKLDIGELNFSKKNRGKKKVESLPGLPEVLTRRDCVSKVAEIYDLTGKVTPIIASMKLDLHVLIQRQLGWDDKVPDELRPIWESHFEMMEELDKVKFNRAVVPTDATALEVDTIDAADASQAIACSAIYVRFSRKNGKHSCQLVFSRSKILPEGITQPRAELVAANMNAHTGEVVRRSLKEFHRNALKLTDSQIVIHWISNRELRLKQWVRNRVIDILRFTKISDWRYVHSSDMVADLGTRRGAKVADVLPGSVWNNGYPWMSEDVSNFPVKTCSETKLSNNELTSLKEELIVPKTDGETADGGISQSTTSYLAAGYTINQIVPSEVQLRYEFSQYIYDPNKYGYSRAIRVLALINRFVSRCKRKLSENEDQSYKSSEKGRKDANDLSNNNEKIEDKVKRFVVLSDEELQEASNYFFKKATSEVKEFNKKEVYTKNTLEKNGILYFKGRILPDQNINIISPLSAVMKDLCTSTFCVPVVDRHSPLAYSIINEVHWNDKVAKHTGVETVLRYTMKYAYILEGRELVKKFRQHCDRCRFITKRVIDVSMGPLSKHNITVAPAFYITQTDLAGPFSSYSPHNKRTTVKIWFLVFCCATTATVNVKVMENYNTTAFIQGFIRLACEVGYPKILLTDEGGQLIKGCKTMKLNFHDIRSRLHLEMNVELETCPVGGHNMHGKVERKIRQIRESIEKSLHNERLSILEWETLGAEIANSINDLPIGIRSIVSDLENLDLITPNRLRLGRNNDRSPVGPMLVSNNPDKFLESNKKIFNAWFDAWLISHVPSLIEQPKWFKSDRDVSEGDVVLFLKQEGSFSSDYQYGMIARTYRGKDDKIRSVDVKYRNYTENVDRITRRAVRQLVMIHPVEELNILTELYEISTAADIRSQLESKGK